MSDVSDWWRTAIIDMAPGKIHLRGQPIQSLIGQLGFAEMIWLMVVGERIDGMRARLLEAALVAAVDHGPQAPSIAAARMAATCGVGLNNALATGVNMLGDVHGGAGEQAVQMYTHVLAQQEQGVSLEESICDWQKQNGKYLPGLGHRFHKPEDPRAPCLLALVEEARQSGEIEGRYADVACRIQAHIVEQGRALALNIDGATAVIYAELGCPAPLARGLFCLSRSVGVLAHAWEQMQQGGRNKGPTPPHYRWAYDGE